MKNPMKQSLLGLTAAIALSSSAYGADPVAAVKYRQATMAALGGHMSASGAILKGEVEHKGHLASHLEGVASMLKLAGDLFPAGSDKGQTDALPTVWERPAEFKKAVDAAQVAAGKLSTAIKSGDFEQQKAAFGEVGKSCKGCHEDFRKKK